MPDTPQDERLLRYATDLCNQSRQALLALIGNAPGARATIAAMLQLNWQLDSDHTRLRFFTRAGTPASSLTLTEACAFVFQQPSSALLDTAVELQGLAPGHSFQELIAREVYDRLKALAPEAFLLTRWNEYWAAREPGTALARKNLAQHHYRQHHHAACQLGLLPLNDPAAIDAAFEAQMNALQHDMLKALSTGLGDNLAEHGAASLLASDQFDQQRRSQIALVEAPQWSAPAPEPAQLLPTFGSLSLDIPPSLRQASIASHQAAFAALLGEDFQGDANDPRLHTLSSEFQRLRTAQDAAYTAAHALVQANAPQDLYALRYRPNAHYDALYRARIEGLLAEGQLQRTLAQLDGQEHALLIAALSSPGEAPPASVATLTLTLHSEVSHSEELAGALLISQGPVQHTKGSVLLYLPGRGAGLQRFASRDELERTLFKHHPDDTQAAITYAPLHSDPMEYSLQSQLYRCEQEAKALLRTYPSATHAVQQAEALQQLIEQTRASLLAVENPAREQAYLQLLEQNQSSQLAGHLPTWLATLPAASRLRLKTLINAYITAMQLAHDQLEHDLPLREDFSRVRIQRQLREDFAVEAPYAVLIDVPDAVNLQKEIISGAGTAGTPFKLVPVASQARTTLTLEALAQLNIDPDLRQRLTFMRVDIQGGSVAGQAALRDGIDKAWLINTVTTLDLARLYEQCIRDAFMGAAQESEFSRDFRRECLLEPIRLMLKLQGEYARVQLELDDSAYQILNTAIDAASRAAYQVDGREIELLPATLTSGGTDTDGHAVTLSGVTFIHERISGQTLLYLPDVPDGNYLRHYPSLEAAREGLFRRTLDNDMIPYLAGRTLLGDPQAHISRLNQAHVQRFDKIVGVGQAWPASTSLANHLLDAQMGRLIEAHRSSARSNDALYLDNAALQHGMVFNYLKMALGMLPFVGTAIALYDAWDASNLAVTAFVRGQIGQGVYQIESALCSLLDAALDLLPGVPASAVSARALARQRQLSALGTLGRKALAPSMQQARRVIERFSGYECLEPVNLLGLQAASEGIYRGVYRHAQGDFILCQGRLYQVELHDSPRTWRLSGTPSKTYKQPIALDESGLWNTHGALYGTLVDGGLAGGGNTAGHLADALDPLWPLAIRERLPRWWRDRAHRRFLALKNASVSKAQQLSAHHETTVALQRQHLTLDGSPQGDALFETIRKRSLKEVAMAEAAINELNELLPLTSGNNQTAFTGLRERIVDIYIQRAAEKLTIDQMETSNFLDQLDALNQQPMETLADYLSVMQQRRHLTIRALGAAEALQVQRDRIMQWSDLGFDSKLRQKVKTRVRQTIRYENPNIRDLLKTANLLELVNRYDAINDLSWIYLEHPHLQQRLEVIRALGHQRDLSEINSNVAQRRVLLDDCIRTYQQYQRALNAWTSGYPEFFDMTQVVALREGLERATALAEAWLRRMPRPERPAPIEGVVLPTRRIFELEGQGLVIGEEVTAGPAPRFSTTGPRGRQETYEQAADGRWHLLQGTDRITPDIVVTDVRRLTREARARVQALPAYTRRAQGYAQQGMQPVDLEQLMLSEANELDLRAQRIAQQDPQAEVIAVLNSHAHGLRAEGRALRIRQTLTSQTPTEGHLDYLISQGAADLIRTGARTEMLERLHGRRDFLQEYEVRDLSRNPPQPLWWAHFHYNNAQGPFANFEKAHLKLPTQRFLGLQWQQAQAEATPIWRGNIGRPLAERHFSTL